MRYSYEYKRKAVELYMQGEWPETPEGIKNPQCFRAMIRKWANLEKANGPDILKHKGHPKDWTPEEKLQLIQQVLAGRSNNSVATEVGIRDSLLYQWVRKYKKEGYNGLVNKKRGRPGKEPIMKRNQDQTPLTESEREELIRLRAKATYLEAENEVIKKEIALREEKEAARLKAKKQQLSKNSEKKDIS